MRRIAGAAACALLAPVACADDSGRVGFDSWYHPALGTTWQWQLQGELDTSYDVDLYDLDLFDTSEGAIAALQADGRRVICYFSAGSHEDFREDAGAVDAVAIGEPLDGYPDERWLDTRAPSVRALVAARLERAVAKGCDGVEPDNVDGYANPTGFDLGADDQLDFNRFVAREAHARGLAVGLKNDLDQIEALVEAFDFALDEQCHEHDECELLAPFVARGKPVFVAEYAARFRDDPDARAAMCAASRDAGLHTLVLPVELDGSFRHSCDP